MKQVVKEVIQDALLVLQHRFVAQDFHLEAEFLPLPLAPVLVSKPAPLLVMPLLEYLLRLQYLLRFQLVHLQQRR